MSRTLRIGFLTAACLSAVFHSTTTAGEAFFSKDGKVVTLAPCGTYSGLVRVDVATGKTTDAVLPKELMEECIDSIAPGSEGETLFLAKGAVWAWTPGAKPEVKRICSTAPVEDAQDLAVCTVAGAPVKDWMFVSGTQKGSEDTRLRFFARKPGDKEFMPIFCRSIDEAIGAAFAPDGRLFFLTDGDVWEGGIQTDDDAAGAERLGVLVASRMAPVAALTTDEASGGPSATHLAVAGAWVYAHLEGRHHSAVVRVPKPAKVLYGPGTTEGGPSVSEQHAAMARALGQTEVIVDDLERLGALCATEVDGKPRVFYHDPVLTDKGSTLMLWEGKGKPRIIGYLSAE